MCSLFLFRPPNANVNSYQLNRLLSASEVAVGTSFRFCGVIARHRDPAFLAEHWLRSDTAVTQYTKVSCYTRLRSLQIVFIYLHVSSQCIETFDYVLLAGDNSHFSLRECTTDWIVNLNSNSSSYISSRSSSSSRLSSISSSIGGGDSSSSSSSSSGSRSSSSSSGGGSSTKSVDIHYFLGLVLLSCQLNFHYLYLKLLIAVPFLWHTWILATDVPGSWDQWNTRLPPSLGS